MPEKVGRNDPCPCGSGKKYKQCCMQHPAQPGKHKFKAVLLSQPKKPINLMERAFGPINDQESGAENLLITEAYPTPEEVGEPTGHVAPLESETLSDE